LTNDRARFAIGIDLGTTNSALAFAPLVGEGTPEVLLIPQWGGLATLTEKSTLPSFLYLPEEAIAAHLRGEEVGAGQWIVGLFARMNASEAPGRVVHSAKSWLCHHAADRSAPFLPWGSAVLTRDRKISPIRASALILNYLRGTWNSRFAQAGFAFDDQDITVTVPASFDAAAQRLTITAAEEAGFPGDVSRRLRFIAGLKATTQRANYGSGPIMAKPGCDTCWSSISAAAPRISAFLKFA
jgi:molecular chaperone DnaK (HSP70)